jgi:hypothetical protein
MVVAPNASVNSVALSEPRAKQAVFKDAFFNKLLA